jgi:hypothetical protein
MRQEFTMMKAALAGVFAAVAVAAAGTAGAQKDDPDQSFTPGPPPSGEAGTRTEMSDNHHHEVVSPQSGDILGDVLAIDELDGQWVGTWTRRPGSDTFDAVWHNQQGQEAHDVVRLGGISGDRVTFVRQGVSGPAGGIYTGRISADGRSIRGTASWYQPGWEWTARIGGGAAGQETVSGQTQAYREPDHDSHDRHAPPPREAQLSDNWNTAACGFTDTATLDLGGATRLTRITLWYNWRAGETAVNYVVTSGGRQVGAGTLHRGSCDPYQGAWCEAQDGLSADFDAGHYRLRLESARLCQNGGSDGAGFIRAWGYRSGY